MLIIENIVKKVIGTWNAAAVLRQSKLQMTPIQFVAQLKTQSVEPCPECRRYRNPGKCVCEDE
jgi:hypothetical protein